MPKGYKNADNRHVILTSLTCSSSGKGNKKSEYLEAHGYTSPKNEDDAKGLANPLILLSSDERLKQNADEILAERLDKACSPNRYEGHDILEVNGDITGTRISRSDPSPKKTSYPLQSYNLVITQLICKGDPPQNRLVTENKVDCGGLGAVSRSSQPLSYQNQANLNRLCLNNQTSPKYQPNGVEAKAVAFDPKTALPTQGDAAAVLLYIPDKKKTGAYILLAREAGGRDQGKWSPVLGKTSDKPGAGYPQVAREELEEETAGVYSLKDDGEVLAHPHSVQRDKHRKTCTFLVPAKYTPSNEILAARNGAKSSKYQEMDNYAWVSLNELMNNIGQGQNSIKSLTGESPTNKQTLHLRDITVKVLKAAQADGSLQPLLNLKSPTAK